MEFSVFLWLAIVASLIIARFAWKAFKKGITIVLVAVIALWAFRAFIPEGWNYLSEYVQASLHNILRR